MQKTSLDNTTSLRPVRRYGAKRFVLGAAIALVGTAGFGLLVVGLPILSVGTAYVAKTLCSEVFVAGRRVDDIMTDVRIDDLGALRAIHAEVDMAEKTATARFFPFASRRAHFRDGFGCTLESRARGIAGHRPDVSPRSRGGGASTTRDTVAGLPPNVSRAIEAVLDEAFAEPDSAHRRRTRAVVVMRHGEVVAERYAPGFSAATPFPGWSMAKSVLNALVGVAIGEGKLALNGPVHLRAWGTPGDARSRISVSDLLQMSSGLQFDEDQASASSDLLRMLFDAPDMAAFAASKQLDAGPGTTWRYSTGTSMILSQVLREALGDEAYHAFPHKVLFGPLEMSHAVLEVDEGGTFVASSYMYATAREWARFGQLYLQDGVWMGKRILPEGWIKYTRTPAPTAPPSTYGAHFWLSTPDEYRGPAAGLPPDVFQAVGHEAQFVTIVPSHDVVIVRLGRTRYPSAWQQDRFVAAVLGALQSCQECE